MNTVYLINNNIVVKKFKCSFVTTMLYDPNSFEPSFLIVFNNTPDCQPPTHSKTDGIGLQYT
jgi:hypothetical protein